MISSNLDEMKTKKRKSLSNRLKNNLCVSLPIVLVERLSLKNFKSKLSPNKEVTSLEKQKSDDSNLIHDSEADKNCSRNEEKEIENLDELYKQNEFLFKSENELVDSESVPDENLLNKLIKKEQIENEKIPEYSVENFDEKNFVSYDDSITEILNQNISDEDLAKKYDDDESSEPIILIYFNDGDTKITRTIPENLSKDIKIEETEYSLSFRNKCGKDMINSIKTEDTKITDISDADTNKYLPKEIKFFECKVEDGLKYESMKSSDNEMDINESPFKSLFIMSDLDNKNDQSKECISLKETDEKDQNVIDLDKIPDSMSISDDSDSEVIIINDNNVEDDVDENLSYYNNNTENDRSLAILEQRLLTSKKKKDLMNENEREEDIQMYSLNGKYPQNRLLNIPLECSKCGGIYKGKYKFQKHWYMCDTSANMNCRIYPEEYGNNQGEQKCVQILHNHNVKMKQSPRINGQIMKNKRTEIVEDISYGSKLLRIPEFITLYCGKCGIQYDNISSSYNKKCDKCNVNLRIHCKKCDKHCVMSFRIIKHLKGTCSKRMTFQCSICSYTALYKSHLQDHVLRKHTDVNPEDFEPCSNMCGRSFKLHGARMKHEVYCGKEAHLFCKFCSFKTKHRSAIKMHVQQHVLNNEIGNYANLKDEDVQFIGSKSKPMSKDAINAMQLSFENSIQNSIEAFCYICKITKVTDINYMCDNCNIPMRFKCKKCFVEKNSFDQVRIHVIKNHNEQIYQCFKCGRRFGHTMDLKKHITTCGKRPHLKCKQCPFETTYNKGLQMHMKRKHPNNFHNLFSCRKCGKIFTMNDTLRRHERNFCGIEPRFMCAHCEFKTKSKFSLTRHIQCMHATLFANFQYFCQFCRREFNNLFSFDQHVSQCRKY